jgi:hypothetical protein
MDPPFAAIMGSAVQEVNNDIKRQENNNTKAILSTGQAAL